MNPLFFLHNPKAAGSSLRALLAAPFDSENVAPVFLNSPYDCRSVKEISSSLYGFQFYAGHYGHDAFRALGRGHKLITNFRDPVQRIKSIYRYWRNDVVADQLQPAERPPIDLAQRLSFSEFIRHPDPALRLYIENFHFRQLLGTGWKARSCTVWDRMRVKYRITRMAWIYVQEMSKTSIELLRHTMPIYRDITLPSINVTSGPREPIAEADARYIASINRLDYEIHAFASRLQAKRAAAMQVGSHAC